MPCTVLGRSETIELNTAEANQRIPSLKGVLGPVKGPVRVKEGFIRIFLILESKSSRSSWAWLKPS